QLSCSNCGRVCGDDELNECLRCGEQYCERAACWECSCDREATEIVQRAQRSAGVLARVLTAFLMLLGVAGAQRKPVQRISEPVARQSFVLLQFISEHGRDEAYDTFISQQLDGMRTFKSREADAGMVDLLESYAGAESMLGSVDDLDAKLALAVPVSGCYSAVRASIVGRHVVRAKACDAAHAALRKALK